MSEITQQEYKNEVEATAETVIDIYNEYKEDYALIHEVIHEEIDNHQWIIYNAYHLDILKYADNEPEGWYIYVSDENMSDYRNVLQAMAYVSLQLDVTDKVSELHG